MKGGNQFRKRRFDVEMGKNITQPKMVLNEKKVNKVINHSKSFTGDDNSEENTIDKKIVKRGSKQYQEVRNVPDKKQNSCITFYEENKSEVLKATSKPANISQKGCTGTNNWEEFLFSQGKKYVRNSSLDIAKTQKKPKSSSKTTNNQLTKVVAMDCEMVGAGDNGKDNLLARVSIVNLFGDCLYDKFVKPKETVTDYRTHVSGVRPSDLKNAEDFDTIQREVAALIKGRILVGHSIKHDMEVLLLTHPWFNIRDTAKFFRKQGARTPALRKLASEYLNVNIQCGEHSSVEDAQACIQLYNMFRQKWEMGGGNKKCNRIDTSPKQ